FGFPVARDTLAFGYKIPAITALFGLGGVYPRTIEIYYMPGTPTLYLLRRIRRRRFIIVKSASPPQSEYLVKVELHGRVSIER
ncbi:MAG: hypothetical protein M0Q51_13390, partial [Bacteroidales bacterium]|nr:hypothetical protein [Bacteroidales bacterium]